LSNRVAQNRVLKLQRMLGNTSVRRLVADALATVNSLSQSRSEHNSPTAHIQRDAGWATRGPDAYAPPTATSARRQEAAASIDYDSFSDADGFIPPDKEPALNALVLDKERLERVYADAQGGLERARRVFQQIEATFRAAGATVAGAAHQPDCLIPAYHELKGAFAQSCIPDWSSLDFLSRDRPAGVRLRHVLGVAYAEQARTLTIRNDIIMHALNLLFAASVASKASRGRVVEVGESAPPAGAGSKAGAVSEPSKSVSAKDLPNSASATEPQKSATATESSKPPSAAAEAPKKPAPGETAAPTPTTGTTGAPASSLLEQARRHFVELETRIAEATKKADALDEGIKVERAKFERLRAKEQLKRRPRDLSHDEARIEAQEEQAGLARDRLTPSRPSASNSSTSLALLAGCPEARCTLASRCV